MQEQGLVGLERLDIIRGVIFEDNPYAAKNVVTKSLPKYCKKGVNIPVFYYLNKADFLKEDGSVNFSIDFKLESKVKIDIKAFQNKTERKIHTYSKLAKYKSISQLYEEEDRKHFFSILPYIKTELIKNELDFLLDILKNTFDSNLESHFVRAVCVYDFIKYSNKV